MTERKVAARGRSSEALDAYYIRRREVRTLVLEYMRAAFPELRVRGSFARGDFHLARHYDGSYADLDLLLPGVSEDDRFALATEVASGLSEAAGMTLPVSVQPLDAFESLPDATSRYIYIGEYIRRSTAIHIDDPRQDYFRAKLALGLSRVSQACSDRTSVGVRKALYVKLGVRHAFSSIDFHNAICQDCVINDNERRYLRIVALGERCTVPALELYIEGLYNLEGLPSWLRSLMTRLVTDSAVQVANDEEDHK